MSELNKQGMVDILENDGEIDFANALRIRLSEYMQETL